MKLMSFYRAILSAANLVADDAGFISTVAANGNIPFSVGQKRLVLPTKEHMQNPDKSEIVLFHPLNESILKGESDVLARFRWNMSLVLNHKLHELMSHLIQLAASPGEHSKLKPDQMELLRGLGEADEKTLINWRLLLKAMPLGNTDKNFVHFFIKRNGLVNGRNHLRVCVTTFPLYKELLTSENTVYGVKVRKKDHQIFKSLLESVLPNLDKDGFYNQGSVGETAPTIEALMRGLIGVASHVNAIIDLFEDVIPELKEYTYDDSWVEHLNNVEKFAAEVRMIPMQAGNEGSIEKAVTQQAPQLGSAPPMAAAPAYQPAPVVNHPSNYHPHQAPVVAPAPSGPPRSANGLIDFSAAMRASGQPQGMGFNQNYNFPPPGPMGNRDPRQAPAYERLGFNQQPQQQAWNPNAPFYPGQNGNLPRI